MTILLGVLRVIGLQGLSLVFGAWLSPVLRIGLCVAAAGGLVAGIYALWPSGNDTERAVREALSQRETITQANSDEERHDNAWLDEQQRWMQAERDAAAKAAGAGADRVIWRADDPWLRAKRSTKAR